MISRYSKGESQDKRDGYIVTLGHSAAVLHALEVLIPSMDREWRPELQAWWVNKGYEKHLDYLFNEFNLAVKQQGKLL